MNIVHKKPRPQGQQTLAAQQQQSGRVPIASPLHASKVQLVDPADTHHVTRVGIRGEADGSRVRFARKSGGGI